MHKRTAGKVRAAFELRQSRSRHLRKQVLRRRRSVESTTIFVVDLPHNQLNQRIAGFVVLDEELAPQPRDYSRRGAFNCDEDVVVQVSAGD